MGSITQTHTCKTSGSLHTLYIMGEPACRWSDEDVLLVDFHMLKTCSFQILHLLPVPTISLDDIAFFYVPHSGNCGRIARRKIQIDCVSVSLALLLNYTYAYLCGFDVNIVHTNSITCRTTTPVPINQALFTPNQGFLITEVFKLFTL